MTMTGTFDQRRYQPIWLETHSLPYPCFFCAQAVEVWNARTKDGGVIHHVDGDHWNDAPENLVAAHHGCHMSHHRSGRKLSAETRAKITAAMPEIVRKRDTPEYRAKLSEGVKRSWREGRTASRGHTYTMSRVKCPACGIEVSAQWLTRHRCDGPMRRS